MRKKIISDINVTPLVDIMLVLLVVFMITAPMLMPTIEVDLPNTSSKNTSKEDNNNNNIIMITVTKSGEIYVQDKLTTLTHIKSEIEYHLDGKSGKVFIRGDKNVAYDSIMHALIAVKNSGVNNVSLVTDTELK